MCAEKKWKNNVVWGEMKMWKNLKKLKSEKKHLKSVFDAENDGIEIKCGVDGIELVRDDMIQVMIWEHSRDN